ncbi:FimV family protein [Chitinibacter sp. GC72]|uniref:type IV pilus assembly protein FimV n=1 Tax=Chitinibacter sp. GC72 TaxID=1526917 RepID=UPI0012FCB4DD|nr:hypothetical protein [Chitinibacter sp. GC72]
MNKTFSPLIFAPIALLLAMQGSHAMTLGELQLKSYIGQRFMADIPYRLGSDEQLLEDCYQLRQGSSDASYIGAASIQLIPYGDGSSGVIRLVSGKNADEPIVGFAFHVECNNINLTRDFLVFLDPAPIVDVPVVSDRTAISKLPTSIEGRRATKGTTAITVRQNTSLEDIAQRYYPTHSPEYQRYLARLKRSNPELAEMDTVAAGSRVNIPVRHKAKPVAMDNRPMGLADNSNVAGKLRIEGEERSAAVAPKSDQARPDVQIKELETKIAELSELRKKLQLEIEALDQRLAQSALAMKGASAVVTQTPTALPAQPLAASAIQVAPAVKKRSTEEEGGWHWPLFIGLGTLGAAIWWWLRRNERNDADSVSISDSIMSVLKTNFVPRTPEQTQLSLVRHADSAFEVIDEDVNGMDQVQLYLVQGDTLRAIELMQQLLDADPLDVERWLMLFRVYRQQGMKSDYIQLAHKFRAQTPTPADDDWELVRSIGFKLAPECPLFTRLEPAEKTEPAEVDLAIVGLSAAVTEPAAESMIESAPVVNEAGQDQADLMALLQPQPQAKAAYKAPPAAPLIETGADVPQIPPVAVLKNPSEMSSLDQFEFNVEDIQFDDEKQAKKS